MCWKFPLNGLCSFKCHKTPTRLFEHSFESWQPFEILELFYFLYDLSYVFLHVYFSTKITEHGKTEVFIFWSFQVFSKCHVIFFKILLSKLEISTTLPTFFPVPRLGTSTWCKCNLSKAFITRILYASEISNEK